MPSSEFIKLFVADEVTFTITVIIFMKPAN